MGVLSKEETVWCPQPTHSLALVTNNPSEITKWFPSIKVIVPHKPPVCLLEGLMYGGKCHP